MRYSSSYGRGTLLLRFIDIKVMCIEAGISQAKLAQKIDTTPAYVNRVIRQKETVVNRTFISMVEALGYDIQLTYVKRSKKKKTNENEN